MSVLVLFKVTTTKDILRGLSLKCPGFFHIWPFAHLNHYFFLSFLLQLCQDIYKQLTVVPSGQVRCGLKNDVCCATGLTAALLASWMSEKPPCPVT